MDQKPFNTFLKILEKEDKDKALLFILEQFENGHSIRDVYEQFLIPALQNFECPDKDEEICIWREHTRTSIIRTILESSYQFIIKQRQPSLNISVLVVCPQEEYHEIGAIIANHYFSLMGFTSQYIGANTPNPDIISAIRAHQSDYVAISITNYYNLVVTKKLTEAIRKALPDVKIILGGQATKQSKSLAQLQYDKILSTYEEIEAFRDEVVQ